MEDRPAISSRERRNAWIEAVRLRTLPLAASGSFIAAGIAAAAGAFRPEVFALMLLVSVLLQVIANFADDYGDLAHGLDDETRVGPKRGMQRGIISVPAMRWALIGTSLVTIAAGCTLIYVAVSSGPEFSSSTPAVMSGFLALGLAAIAAAILYTVGPYPYGYLGLGDIMSFFFFGLVAVIAGSFLYLHEVSGVSVLCGFALGLPVAAVMNINNMRDSLDDAAKGKRTIANRLYARGVHRAAAILAGMSPQEVAASSLVFQHGRDARAQAEALDARIASGDVAARAFASDPARSAALLGERFMRCYQVILIHSSLVLFLVAVFWLKGFTLRGIICAALVLAASKPLLSALGGVAHELDHTKLDRFMAPTSLGTVFLALVFSLCAALA